MKKHLYQFKVETDDGMIVISQENSGEDDDSILLDPCQVDLLIQFLREAKEEFTPVKAPQ